ncbi:MAG TPA: hypothetical protein VMS65_18080 [Polyangiaceae bacterium]|nr:hypothetical protein [Polyangiaceae bacterium]
MALAHELSAALEEGARQVSLVSARVALRPLDPLARLVAQRRMTRLIERAKRESTNDDPAHVLRLAALLAVKPVPEASLDDARAVEAELTALGPRTIRKRPPWWTLGALAFVGCVVAGIVVLRSVLAPFDARATPVGHALDRGLSEGVRVASSRGGARDAARAVVGAEPSKRAFGDDGVQELVRLLDAAERLAAVNPESGSVERDAYLASAENVGRLLQKKQLPYFVDADVLSGTAGYRPILMSSYVEREVTLVLGGRSVRALHLWRLDRGVRFGALGYTRPRTPAALVLLDQVETDLVRWVLPALPEGESMELVDDDTRLRPEPWVTDVERRAAGVLRRHYEPFRSDPAVERVGRLLARRRALVKKWTASLSGQGLSFNVPERLVPEGDYAKELEIRITRANLREWDELHAELLSRETLAGFAKLRDRYTLSIERHEAQHRYDFSRGFIPLPELVLRMVGAENPLDAPEGGYAASVRNEFSSYLAQLGTGSDSPLLDLVLMTRLSLSRDTVGTAHAHAAVTCLLAVGRELGIAPEPYLERGMRRRDVADLFLAIVSHPPASIRSGAVAAYQKSFGVPLPTVASRTVHDHVAWRH